MNISEVQTQGDFASKLLPVEANHTQNAKVSSATVSTLKVIRIPC